jgi:hypothetical protein
MKTVPIKPPARILLAIVVLPFWLVLAATFLPLAYGETVRFSPTTPAIVLLALVLTTLVIVGRVPVFE